MTSSALDYSWSRPSPDAIRAAGYELVLRYFSPDTPRTHGKILFAEEAAALLGAGLDLATVFESTAQRVLDGAEAGEADGQVALAQAQACGEPDDAAIYYAVDFDIAARQLDQLYAYSDAFAVAIAPHPVGCYGGLLAVTAALEHGVPYGWQTIAWSHGRQAAGICLMQGPTVTVDGAQCDHNTILAPYGGWNTPTPPAPDKPITVTTGPTTEEDMDTAHDVHVPQLDDNGNGYVDLDVPAPARVKSINANGQDPATNGYGHAPLFDSERLGDVIRVNIHGGIPKGALDFTVWTTT